MIVRWSVLAAGLFGLAVLSCEFERPLTPITGYEMYDQNCSDNIDNDHDSLVDCEDPHCFLTSTLCGEIIDETGFVEPEGDANANQKLKIITCHDFIDNDLDGQWDCGDRDCQAIQENCCSREFTDAACSDGVDNDQNGFTDCEDFSCSRGLFVDVCSSSSSGDSEPIGDPVPEVSLEQCMDDIDNDQNGYTDCADFSCSQSEDQTVNMYCANLPKEDTLETCSNGVDEDENGFVDCDDFSCSKSDDQEIVDFCAEQAAAAGQELTLEECTDGEDNDDNGYTDCADFSCSQSDDAEVAAHCAALAENTFDKCKDGVDNDGNGYVDCNDNNCVFGDAETFEGKLRHPCQESVGADAAAMNANCDDGLDNDADGFVDCEDWDCSYNPQVTVCIEKGPRLCE